MIVHCYHVCVKKKKSQMYTNVGKNDMAITAVWEVLAMLTVL